MEIPSFYTHKCSKNHDICYIFPEIWHMADVIVIFHFVFGLFFARLTP